MKRGKHTESISIDHPIFSRELLRRGGIDVDVIEPSIRHIHQVDSPERRVHDMEVLDCDIACIPPDEWHRSARRGDALVCGVPVVSCAINAANTPAVDVNVFAAEDDASDVVLLAGEQLMMLCKTFSLTWKAMGMLLFAQ